MVLNSVSKDTDVCIKPREYHVGLTPSARGPQSVYCRKYCRDLIQIAVSLETEVCVCPFATAGPHADTCPQACTTTGLVHQRTVRTAALLGDADRQSTDTLCQ